MKSSAKGSKKTRTEPVPSVVVDEDAGADAGRRLECIATAAYYKAEERGFVPGMDVEDWLEAESEYDEVAEGR
jgi:hypothetical protein